MIVLVYLDNLQHIRLSTCHSLHPFTYSFIFRSIARLFFLIERLLHICLFFCHSLLPSTDLSIFLSLICQFVFTTSQHTTHLFIHLSFIHSFHLFIHLSFYLFTSYISRLFTFISSIYSIIKQPFHPLILIYFISTTS